MITAMTPILFVDAIEPCLGFWTERLGFAKVAEVPHGDRLGFVILVKEHLQVMLQTLASLQADLVGVPVQQGGCVYLTVSDFDAIVKALEGCDVVVPPRKTFYGADEIWVREPGGNLLGFSYHAS